MDTKQQIQRALAEAVAAAFPDIPAPAPEAIQLTVPRQREHGDLATNLAMAIAKPLDRPPRHVAEALADRLRTHPAIERADVAGPGFLNLTIRAEAVAAILQQIETEGERFGTTDLGRGRRAL